jgi:hypothetical protein
VLDSTTQSNLWYRLQANATISTPQLGRVFIDPAFVFGVRKSIKGLEEMREEQRVQKEYGSVISSPNYRKQRALTERLRKEREEEEKEAEARKKLWDMDSPSPMIVTLHEDRGRIPGGVRLQIDDNEASRSIIHRRAARLTGDLDAEPDAVLGTSLEELSEELATA